MRLKLMMLTVLSLSGSIIGNCLTLDEYVGLVDQLRLELNKSDADSSEIRALVAQIFTSTDSGPNPIFMPAISAVKGSFINMYRSDPEHLPIAARVWFEKEKAKYLRAGDSVMMIVERTNPDAIRECLLHKDLIPWLEKHPAGFLEIVQILKDCFSDDIVIKRRLDSLLLVGGVL